MFKKILLFPLFFLAVACGFKRQVIVSGQLEGSNEDTLYIKELTEEPYGYYDSVIVKNNGSFKLKVEAKFPAFYSIYKNKNSNITLYLKPGDRVKLTGQLPDLKNLNIEGSPACRELNKLFVQRNKVIREAFAWIDSIHAARDTVSRDKDVLRYDSLIEDLFNKHKRYSIDFIKRNSRSPVAIIALQQYIGERPVFDFKKDFNYFNMIDSILMITDPDAEAVKFLHSQVTYFRDIQKIPDVGKKAPELTLPDTSGKLIRLSSFRGKYVLLDFWASFCPPCRSAHPYMRKAWWNYHWRGFEILQVSIDRTKEAWIKALKTDGIHMWTHVSDLKMWNSIAVSLYRFTEIPANYLINPEGIIIEKNIPAEKLEEVLNAVYSKPGK